jgi:hypothetical protein
MDHRINLEYVTERERQIHDRQRRRWPDDGLPSQRKYVRPNPSLHPASLIAELFWR